VVAAVVVPAYFDVVPSLPVLDRLGPVSVVLLFGALLAVLLPGHWRSIRRRHAARWFDAELDLAATSADGASRPPLPPARILLGRRPKRDRRDRPAV
jgi:hypothetical protein